MKARLLAFLGLTVFATVFFSRSLAQLPTCGIVYGVSNAEIYNYNPVLPVSSSNPSKNSIPVPTLALPGALGLTVCPILGTSSSTLTFYSIMPGSGTSAYNYAYYDPSTSSWVNTGHSVGGSAVNIAAGGGYIFSLEGSTGRVFRYDGTGNATLLITVGGFRGASPFDLVADCDGNWYILNYNGQGSTPFLRKYSPTGVWLQSWTMSNPYSLSATPAAGFGINGNVLYTDTRGSAGSAAGVAFYTLGSTTLRLDSMKGFPGVNSWIDIGTCAAAVPSIPMINITASDTTGCAGDTVTLSASTISGGSAPIFQWKINGVNVGPNDDTFRYVPSHGDVVTCVLTSNSICASPKVVTSNPVTLSVTATPVTPSIGVSASANSLCVGIPVTFTATASNGGTSPVYQWSVNGTNVGTGGTTYTYTPATGDTVRCTLASSLGCVTSKKAVSTPVVVNVITTTPALSISSSASFICAGDVVSFLAAPVNGGTSPAFQWKVNGSNVGTNSAGFRYVPSNGDVVSCVLTSNATCLTTPSANSNTLTLSVIAAVVPSVSISATDTGVCAGTTVTFSALPTNGGTAPGYLWSVNRIVVGAGTASYSYKPLNGDTVVCILSSNANCVSPVSSASNKLVMSVGVLVIPGINVNTRPPIVGCEGTPILFYTNIVAGGTAPAYQWYLNGVPISGATNPSYTSSALKNGDTVRATLISSEPCPSTPITWSNIVGLSLGLPVTPVISISPAGPIPAGVPQLFTASISGGGASPKFQWMKNGLSIPYAIGPTFSSASLSARDVISVSLLSSDLCATPTFVVSNDVLVNGTTGIGSNKNDWYTMLYPNPNTGNFTLAVHDRSNAGGRRYTIDVINSVGQSIYHNETDSKSAEFKQEINLPGNIPAGSYFMRVRSEEGGAATIPFLIVR
jgi:hypothetical protein